MISGSIVFLSEKSAEIPSLDMIGGYGKSANQKYVVVVSDSDPSGSVAGSRESGHGRYVLLEDERIIVQGLLERPNDPHVANDGTFVISDWLFGPQLASIIYIFEANGSVLIRRKFVANLFSSSISDDGAYAACQLCNSDSDDGGLLVLFDIKRLRVQWEIHPRTGWPQTYVFDRTAGRLGLGYPERGVFWYNLEDGGFVDTARWTEAQIASGFGEEVLEIAHERLGIAARPLQPPIATELLHLAAVAYERLAPWPREQARAERLTGEIYEAAGNVSAAVDHYRTALKLNPACGVKRRLKMLVGGG